MSRSPVQTLVQLPDCRFPTDRSVYRNGCKTAAVIVYERSARMITVLNRRERTRNIPCNDPLHGMEWTDCRACLIRFSRCGYGRVKVTFEQQVADGPRFHALVSRMRAHRPSDDRLALGPTAGHEWSAMSDTEGSAVTASRTPVARTSLIRERQIL